MKKHLLVYLIIISFLTIIACSNPFWPGLDGKNGNTGNTGNTSKTGGQECVHDWDWGSRILDEPVNKGIQKCIKCNAPAEVGDIGPGGGIIFYVDSNGFDIYTYKSFHNKNDLYYKAYYLEAAPNDEGTAEWSHNVKASIDQVYETGKTFGLGYFHTEEINRYLNEENQTGKAAQLCWNVSYGNFPQFKDNWFLPSIDELVLLYKEKDRINNLSSGFYWSSTYNDPVPVVKAWCLNFAANGSNPTVLGYNVKCNVRAINAF